MRLLAQISRNQRRGFPHEEGKEEIKEGEGHWEVKGQGHEGVKGQGQWRSKVKVGGHFEGGEGVAEGWLWGVGQGGGECVGGGGDYRFWNGV